MPQTSSLSTAEGRQNGSKRPPGRPRSDHARKAILRSTLKLLQAKGFPDLSIEAIASDADEALPGPIVLQGDHRAIEFRSVMVTPLHK